MHRGPRIAVLMGLLALLVAGQGPARAEEPPAFLLSWGRQGSGDGEFYGPLGIAVSADGFVYIADYENNRIQKFTRDSVFVTKWGSYGSGPGQFVSPKGITVDPAGNVYVSDYPDRIQKFDSDGHFVLSWNANSPGFIIGDNIAADPTGAFIYAIVGPDSIIKFTTGGQRVLGWKVPLTHPDLAIATGLAVGPTGYVYVTVEYDGIVLKYLDAQPVLSWHGSGDGAMYHPFGIAVDVDDNVYVACLDWYIRKYTSSGAYLTRWGGLGGGPEQFLDPLYVATDADKNVYVTDATLDRVQKFGSAVTPTVTTTWGRIKSLYRR